MKQLFLCIIVVLALNIPSLTIPFKNHDYLIISPQTHAIHYRYYLIKRVEPAIDIMKKSKYFHTQSISFPHAQHPLIIECQKKIITHTSYKPFIDVWMKISHYQFLHDALLIKDFIALQSTLIYHLLIHHYHLPASKTSLNAAYLSAQKAPPEKQLTFINACVDFFYEYPTKKSHAFAAFRTFLILSKHISYSSSDDIFERFYALKRLEKPIKILCRHDNIINSNQHYAQSMRSLNRFQSIEDEEYFKGILSLLLHAYKNILTQKLSMPSQQKAQESLETLEILYQQTPQLTAEQMLNAIDLFTQELDGLSQEKNHIFKYYHCTRSKKFMIGCAALGAIGAYFLTSFYIK